MHRTRVVVDRPVRGDGAYVLYWMTSARRLAANFALARAADLARAHRAPLVILEALRVDYPWASDRLHRFVIDGMADHARALARTPVTYFPYVERRHGDGRGLVAALSGDAVAVITDDYPSFFLPRMVASAARQVDARLEAVDSNGIVPIAAPARTFATAFSFRAYLQNTLRDHLQAWPSEATLESLPRLAALPRAITTRWPAESLETLTKPAHLLASLPIDHSVPAADVAGGRQAALAALATFVTDRLHGYARDQRQPSVAGTSRLSPYLHFGHLGAHDVFAAVMTAERWTTRKLAPKAGGRREGWWGVSASAEMFLDQLVTWRELAFNMCATQPDDYAAYRSLPAWARATLETHALDRRPSRYSRERLEEAATHDAVWNAAQRELLATGWMHNYMRMLWGKKILEWTGSPEEALETMTAIMNRHALDGRDPNSYAGYAWVLGRYDRPWAPERPIFGTVRYMTSDSAAKKLRLKPYLAQYGGAPTPVTVSSARGRRDRHSPSRSPTRSGR